MIAARPWSDVKQLRALEYVYFVPFTFLDYAALPRAELQRFGWRRISRHSKPAGDDIEYFVTVRMHLATMRCAAFHCYDSRRHAVDPQGRSGCSCSGGNRKVTTNIE